MRAKRNVKSTVRMTEKDSDLFDRASEQFGISKSELLVRSYRFVLSNRTDENEFIAPEFTVRAVLKRFTDLIEQRAEEHLLETASIASNDTSTESESMPAVRKFFSDRAANQIEVTNA